MILSTRIATAVAIAIAVPAVSWAQTYPTQPIRIIVPFTPASPNDVVARILAQHLSTRLGQSVVIDNRPGGGTLIGAKVAAAAEPNGYTLLFNSSSIVVAPAMYKNPGYDPLKSFIPVANTIFGHWTTVVLNSIPASTVPEFVAYAKKNPGKLTFGYGQGTAPQLVGEWLKVREKLDMISVPFKGGSQVITEMLGGRIHFHVGSASTLIPHIQNGSLKAISSWGPQRDPELPDVPTMVESGYPGLALGFWAGVFAPAGTPDAIVTRLNREINESLGSAEMKKSLHKLGLEPVIQTPQEFRQFIVDEWPRWKEIVTISGVKGD
jgi:tripartite-type tricarboxylate transporter receptor subunit TctC